MASLDISPNAPMTGLGLEFIVGAYHVRLMDDRPANGRAGCAADKDTRDVHRNEGSLSHDAPERVSMSFEMCYSSVGQLALKLRGSERGGFC